MFRGYKNVFFLYDSLIFHFLIISVAPFEKINEIIPIKIYIFETEKWKKEAEDKFTARIICWYARRIKMHLIS